MGKWTRAAQIRAAEIAEYQHITSEVEQAGGIRSEVVQSDKIGSDWKIFYVNEVEVRRDYIEQDVPVGTADNPFAWTAGMILVPNGYYVFEGVRKVWTGAYGAVAGWDDTNFLEF